MESKEYFQAKVVLAGRGPCGKTSLIRQLNSGTFEENSLTTSGAVNNPHRFHTDKGDIELNIWDTCGGEQFMNLLPVYFHSCSSIVIVIDVSSSNERIKEWKDDLSQVLNYIKSYEKKQNPLVYIAANKNDLDVAIPTEELNNAASENNCTLIMTSAKDSKSVNSLFQKIAEDCINIASDPNSEVNKISQEEESSNSKNKTCLIE